MGQDRRKKNGVPEISYNAVPPPPSLYLCGESSSNGGDGSDGSSRTGEGDGEKRGRRRPSRKNRQQQGSSSGAYENGRLANSGDEKAKSKFMDAKTIYATPRKVFSSHSPSRSSTPNANSNCKYSQKNMLVAEFQNVKCLDPNVPDQVEGSESDCIVGHVPLRSESLGKLEYIPVIKDSLPVSLIKSRPNGGCNFNKATNVSSAKKTLSDFDSSKQSKSPSSSSFRLQKKHLDYLDCATNYSKSQSSTSNISPCRNEVSEKSKLSSTPVPPDELPNYQSEKQGDKLVNQVEQHVFYSTLRVNAYNRNEAYVTLKGVPIDILIDGEAAQNRALEGDVVAVLLDPVCSWRRMKGSSNKQQHNQTPSHSEASTSRHPFVDDTIMHITGKSSTLTINSSPERSPFNDSQANGSRSELDKFSVGSASQHWKVSNKIDSSMSSSAESNTCVEASTSGANSAQDWDGIDVVEISTLDENSSILGSLPMERGEQLVAAIKYVADLVSLYPDRRPTGKIVDIIEMSSRRKSIVGYLDVKLHTGNKRNGKGSATKVEKDCSQEKSASKNQKDGAVKVLKGPIMLLPVDPRFPKMMVPLANLPESLYQRLREGDPTMKSELVAACVEDWPINNDFPHAKILQSLGQAGEIEAHTAAILFEHAIHGQEFSADCLNCLPSVPWQIPDEEYRKRRDLRNICIFSIDPPTARDLDDALSIEKLDDDSMRIGVHIADVSYFVLPDTPLDKEAQQRSTSVYLIQRVHSMLPRLLCEDLCSLTPGVDRLAFSVMWDFDSDGKILRQWIGKTVINTCCKLSYHHAQDMIDGIFTSPDGTETKAMPVLYGGFDWKDVIEDVQTLNSVAMARRANRFSNGALKLDNAKITFLLDDDGNPCESMFYEAKHSNALVEEFMLLANMSVAKVISAAFPGGALLRRHPEPNLKKLKEFQDLCLKVGVELDAASAGSLQISLGKMQDVLKNDPDLFKILLLYATKPMQLAKYFCTGQLRDNEAEWAHYALATPYYTHFTSPIRRYPDIVVHRTLAAVLEAEEIFRHSSSEDISDTTSAHYFTGACPDNDVVAVDDRQAVLDSVASKHSIPDVSQLALVAEHCNERKLASRNVHDATNKLYLWAMLKRSKRVYSDARIVALGPKFITLYVCKFAMERRIYYDRVEGLNVDWLEETSTLILDTVPVKNSKKGRFRTIGDIALLINPTEDEYSDLEIREGPGSGMQSLEQVHDNLTSDEQEIEPLNPPLTLQMFSRVPVVMQALGGDNRPLDIGVRLYLSSYLA